MLPCSFSIDQYAIWYSQDLYYEARALVLGFIHHWISNLSISFGASVEIGTLIMWKILDPKWITTVLADVNLLEKIAWTSKNPTSTHLGPCPGLALPHVSGCLISLHDSIPPHSRIISIHFYWASIVYQVLLEQSAHELF